ncbi:MAG TPA: hypothetical protein VHZ52_08190 [Acidobacteriaceae bacterium]|nr:hypothetical protein [Acidobacteriaceae bacterium]
MTIYPENQASFGPCECCGNVTSRVWGYINRQDEGIAAYFVEWTPGHASNQANFDLIIGKWGEEAEASDRQAVALEFRKLESGPAFRVIDAKERPVASNSLVSKALDRASVIGTPLAESVFAICDLIFLEDSRISELRA